MYIFFTTLKYVAIIEKSFQDSSDAKIGVPLGLFGNSPGFLTPGFMNTLKLLLSLRDDWK